MIHIRVYTLTTTDKGLVSLDRSRQPCDNVCRNDYHGGGGVRQGLFLCCNLEPLSVPCQQQIVRDCFLLFMLRD